MAFGGGCYSIIMILIMFRDPVFSIGDKFFFIIYMGLYAWGTICGIYILIDHKNGIIWCKLFYALQIPCVMTKYVGYVFYSGIYLTIKYSIKIHAISINYSFGGYFQYNLFQPSSDYYLGINVIAVLIFLYLLKISRTRKLQRVSNLGVQGTA